MLELPKLNLPNYDFKLSDSEGITKIFCTFRRKWVILKPEEWVRQNFGIFLCDTLGYHKSRIKLEKTINISEKSYLADIVYYDNDMNIQLIVECKRPDVKITQKTFNQIGIYNRGLGKIQHLIVTNGMEHYALGLNKSNEYEFLESIPKSTN